MISNQVNQQLKPFTTDRFPFSALNITSQEVIMHLFPETKFVCYSVSDSFYF